MSFDDDITPAECQIGVCEKCLTCEDRGECIAYLSALDEGGGDL